MVTFSLIPDPIAVFSNKGPFLPSTRNGYFGRYYLFNEFRSCRDWLNTRDIVFKMVGLSFEKDFVSVQALHWTKKPS